MLFKKKKKRGFILSKQVHLNMQSLMNLKKKILLLRIVWLCHCDDGIWIKILLSLPRADFDDINLIINVMRRKFLLCPCSLFNWHCKLSSSHLSFHFSFLFLSVKVFFVCKKIPFVSPFKVSNVFNYYSDI